MNKIDAIVYETNTGHTKQYAELISSKTGIPAYARTGSLKHIKRGSAVLYMGWLCAGSVKGLSWAKRTFQVAAVCAVGMQKENQKQNQEIAQKYHLDSTPLFYLNGGFEMEKLTGLYRFMMGIAAKGMGSSLEKKQDKTPEEIEALEMMVHGSNKVDEANLCEVLRFIGTEK